MVSIDERGLADAEFRVAVESLCFPVELFHHLEHIRLAWIYASAFTPEESSSRMAAAVASFAAHHGAARKYHHTITLAWMRLVQQALRSEHPSADFAAFVAAHPELLDQQLLSRYFSSERLQVPDARTSWLSPDLLPLP